MSNTTHHTYRGFAIRFDELEPQGSITMSKATWTALEQLENGSEEHVAKRYQVKSKPKFADGEHKLDTTYATEHEAKARAKVLKDAGHDTEIVPPTEALEPPRSLARFRVEKQLHPTAPFAPESTWSTEAEAQTRAREIDDEDVLGTDVRIVDSKDGSVVQLIYPDGTAVVDEAPELTEDQRAQKAQADQNQRYLQNTPTLPDHPVLAGPPDAPAPTEIDETPQHEWL